MQDLPPPGSAGDPDSGSHDAPTQIGAGTPQTAPAPDTPPVAGGPGGDPGPDATGAGAAERPPAYPGGLQRLADRYQLEEPIASGGAAVVWRAFDDVLSRSVALKLLHPHLAGDPTTVERFRLESINAARLTHTNVVQIYDTGIEQDVVYLVMEYVDGPSLRDIIKQRGAMDPHVVAALGEQVASALGEAHSHGVVHRDVKPANILLTRDGVAKVTDFGIAKALSGNQATLTSPGTVVGTAAYVAPEQLEGVSVDARADVYALGVVLYECLTGKPAFQGDTPTATAAARLTQDLLPPRQIRADVPRALDDVIVRATRRDPKDRFGDGASLAAALQPLVRSKPSDVTAQLLAGRPEGGATVVEGPMTDSGPIPTGSRVPATRREYGRRLVAAFLGGLALAVVALLATQALRSDDGGDVPGSADAYPIAAVGDFDPHGGDGENPDDVGLVSDGDGSTAWQTEGYRDTFEAIGKPGVGLWFDLGEAVPVTEVQLQLGAPGISIEIYVHDGAPDLDNESEEAWARVGAKDDLLVTDAVAVDATARYWLVWISEVAPLGDGNRAASIAEVRFVGPDA